MIHWSYMYIVRRTNYSRVKVRKRQHADAIGSIQRNDVATDSALTLVANLRCHAAAQITN